jgi:transketolase
LQKRKNFTFVLLSDGELDEGSNWEAFLFAAHHKLNNLVAIIDYNKLQSLDTIENTLGLEPIGSKFNAFNWDVKIVDGHCHLSLIKALTKNVSSEKPKVIICNTIKGKGVSFMENQVSWHYRSPQDKELLAAVSEIQNRLDLAS